MAKGVECLGNSKESFFLVSIGYYELLTVTMGYQANNLTFNTRSRLQVESRGLEKRGNLKFEI